MDGAPVRMRIRRGAIRQTQSAYECSGKDRIAEKEVFPVGVLQFEFPSKCRGTQPPAGGCFREGGRQHNGLRAQLKPPRCIDRLCGVTDVQRPRPEEVPAIRLIT
jgi:hypothetical protein